MRTFPHWIAAMGKCLLWNPSVKNQRFLTAPTGREPCGQCPQTISHAGVPPVAISHGNLLRIVTAPPVPGNVTAVEIDARTKAPLVKGGWFCLWQNRGDSVAKATDFFPIPSSLFPKKPSPFHMGLYFLRSACCRIPQSRLRRASSHRPGALRAVPADNFARRGAPGGNFARESSANRYCPSGARYRYRAKWGTKIWALCSH